MVSPLPPPPNPVFFLVRIPSKSDYPDYSSGKGSIMATLEYATCICETFLVIDFKHYSDSNVE